MSQLSGLMDIGELELQSIVMYFANEFNVPLTDDSDALMLSLALAMSNELNIPIPYVNPAEEFMQLAAKECA